MTPARAARKFPQLSNLGIKYCSVFYEGLHDDARTNLAIAQTAGREGAIIANYCEVIELIKEEDNKKVIGAKVLDRLTDDVIDVYAKSFVFCGGPFTDQLREMENPNAKRAVEGASGIHVVVPSYYNYSGMGVVDMNTSGESRFIEYAS